MEKETIAVTSAIGKIMEYNLGESAKLTQEILEYRVKEAFTAGFGYGAEHGVESQRNLTKIVLGIKPTPSVYGTIEEQFQEWQENK